MVLKYKKGSVKKRKRIGRGNGSGHGTTACRGTKGQKSRSGYSRRPGFEGGQMPIVRRLPKFGFHNPFSKKVAIINVGDFDKFKLNDNIDMKYLMDKRIVKGGYDYLKVLGNGEIKKAYKITTNFISKSAKKKIEDAGGSVVIIAEKKPKEKFKKKERKESSKEKKE